jgi:1,4-dihydroxy-2-naphthoate octaprenyltransferase
VILGEARTIKFITWLIASAACLFVVGTVAGLSDTFGLIMLLPAITLSFCVTAYKERRINPGPNLEAMVDGNFILAGLLGLIWQIMQCLR